MSWSQERCLAFCAAIEEAGVKVECYNPKNKQHTTWAKEEPLIRKWIQSLPRPIGMFCANDDLAAAIMETCRILEYGVR